MSDEYEGEFEDEPRLSIVDELTPHVVEDEVDPEPAVPMLRIVDAPLLTEADDEPAPADGVLVIVSDEQLLSALREPGIRGEDEPEPAGDGEPASLDASNDDEPATDDETASDEPANDDGASDDASDDEPSPPAAERPARPHRPQWERPTRIGVAALALIAILFLFVFPTRSYLGQQRQVRTDRRSVAILQAQNKDMARAVAELQTKSEIERMARVQLNMVLPGEQPYSVITPPKSK